MRLVGEGSREEDFPPWSNAAQSRDIRSWAGQQGVHRAAGGEQQKAPAQLLRARWCIIWCKGQGVRLHENLNFRLKNVRKLKKAVLAGVRP